MEVYLDLENGCPLPEKVLKEMLPFLREKGYGHSALTHNKGWETYRIIEENLKKISQILGLEPENLNITPDGVSASNLAILGFRNEEKRKKILISSIEPLHFIYPAEEMQKFGFEVIRIPVDKEGFINENFLFENLDDKTLLLILSWINHEIGTIQNFEEILKKVKEKSPKTIIISDLSDVIGRILFNLNTLPIDLGVIFSHKIYGPKGIGILYKKKNINLETLLFGPYSTQPLWPGEENIPSIVGFRVALEDIIKNIEENTRKIKHLQEKLISGLLNIPYTVLNGSREKRVQDNINISFFGCEGEALTVELSDMGIYISSGSACTRRILQPSHVLLSIGKKYEEAHGSLLMKIWQYHKEEEINYILENFPRAVERIRKISGFKGGL